MASAEGFDNAGGDRQQGQCEHNKHSNFHDLLLAVIAPFRAATGLTQWMAISTTRFDSAGTLLAVATCWRVSPVQRVSTRSAATLSLIDQRVTHGIRTLMRQVHVVVGAADGVGLADDRRDSSGFCRSMFVTSARVSFPWASRAWLLVANSTWYQVAFGPGGTGGGFDATVADGVWAQAASREIVPTAARWRHDSVRCDICVSIVRWLAGRLQSGQVPDMPPSE